MRGSSSYSNANSRYLSRPILSTPHLSALTGSLERCLRFTRLTHTFIAEYRLRNPFKLILIYDRVYKRALFRTDRASMLHSSFLSNAQIVKIEVCGNKISYKLFFLNTCLYYIVVFIHIYYLKKLEN